MVSVVILSAGFGTRMNSKKPKVLHEICGKTIISYVVDVALAVSSDVHVVVYKDKESVVSSIEKLYPKYLLDKIHFHTQNYDAFPGTGGALISLGSLGEIKPINVSNERVLILNGDTPMISSEEVKALSDIDSDVSIGIFDIEDPSGYGRVVIENGKIVKVIEDRDAVWQESLIKTVNSGIYSFNKEVLEKCLPLMSKDNSQGEYYITELISIAVRNGYSCNALKVNRENSIGINNKSQLSEVESRVLNSIRDKAMKSGVTIRIPSSVYIDHGVKFEGECEIENGVSIRGNSIVTDSIIKSGSTIESSRISGSSIGPNANIRPGCTINNSKIGNFVECKNSDIDGAKVGHLSYLGDCSIGCGTNIGAGVITCNYNGKIKSRTNIGKNVFIGSDTQIIAPIEISDDTIIAAGSTITRDVSKGSLAISRVDQQERAGAYYRFFRDNDVSK